MTLSGWGRGCGKLCPDVRDTRRRDRCIYVWTSHHGRSGDGRRDINNRDCQARDEDPCAEVRPPSGAACEPPPSPSGLASLIASLPAARRSYTQPQGRNKNTTEQEHCQIIFVPPLAPATTPHRISSFSSQWRKSPRQSPPFIEQGGPRKSQF